MLKTLLLVFCFFVLLNARENPFFPVQGMQDIPLTSNLKQEIPSPDFRTISKIVKKQNNESPKMGTYRGCS